MIVVDASVVVSLLLNDSRTAPRIRSRLSSERLLVAPHLIDIEIASALRRHCLRGELDIGRVELALDSLANLWLIRWPHSRLLSRIMQLRNALSAYDAAYVALAEMLHTPLITLDGRLAGSSGHAVKIQLL